jgi:hypothetical protein
MTIILSAFNDKLRSLPIEVPEGFGFEYRLAVLPPLNTVGDFLETICTRQANFRFRGKEEHRENYRWGSPPIRIYELEVK